MQCKLLILRCYILLWWYFWLNFDTCNCWICKWQWDETPLLALVLVPYVTMSSSDLLKVMGYFWGLKHKNGRNFSRPSSGIQNLHFAKNCSKTTNTAAYIGSHHKLDDQNKEPMIDTKIFRWAIYCRPHTPCTTPPCVGLF